MNLWNKVTSLLSRRIRILHSCFGIGILIGTLTMELGGVVTINCEKTGYKAEIEFKLKVRLFFLSVTFCRLHIVLMAITFCIWHLLLSCQKNFNNNFYCWKPLCFLDSPFGKRVENPTSFLARLKWAKKHCAK